MPVGYGSNDDVLKAIETTIDNAVDLARSQRQGKGSDYCINPDCGARIPQARRKAVPHAVYCIDCQAEHDVIGYVYYNRRGTHDSQLR